MLQVMTILRIGSGLILVLVLVLALFPQIPAKTDEVAAKATDAEKQALVATGGVQAEAVVTFNEALLTSQAARRAQAYLSAASGQKSKLPPGVGPDLEAMEQRLQALQDRFLDLYRAHFGTATSASGQPISLSDEVKRLGADSKERARAREAFVKDCQLVRGETRFLLHSARQRLAELKKRATDARYAPAFVATPAFVDKPQAKLKPDGTATGILFGMAYGYNTRPALTPLGFDFLGGIYEIYDLAHKPSPVVEAAERGRTAQLIVPCSVHEETYCPVAWYLKNRDKPITRLSAKDGEYRGSWLWPLDFHHPLVREMLQGYLTEVAQRYQGDKRILMYTTAWEGRLTEGTSGEWGKWSTGGRAPAAQDAFRAYLRKKFGTIDKLNQAWQSKYDRFESIQPPADVHHGPPAERADLVGQLFSGASPPLYYEHNRFLLDSYADYLAWCYGILKKADPRIPVSVSPSYGALDGYLCGGRDSFLWAEKCCDLYGSENTSPMEEVFHYSIQRSLSRPTGILEYIWNGPENWTNPSEPVARAAAQRNLWRLVAWGRKVISFYGANDTYGSLGAFNNMLVTESEHHLLRRSAGVIGPIKRKLRSMEDIWLGAPVVEPKIAILHSSTSRICAWPHDIVSIVSQNLHDVLHGHNYHYAFVPEEYVVSGRERLDRFRVLILPNVTHFPPGLTERIEPWVKSGGTLIISGIAGGFTPYGQRDGTLMKLVFGDLAYRPWWVGGGFGRFKWMIKGRNLRPEVRDLGGSAAEILLADYGRGKVLMAVKLDDLRPGGEGVPAMYKLLDEMAPRLAWVEGAKLELSARQSQGRLHIVLINPNSTRPAVARIRLAKNYQLAIDRGIEGGFAVPLGQQGSGQAFDLQLAAGEGTMIDLISRD